MRRIITTFAALLATAGLFYSAFQYLENDAKEPSAQPPLIRVWAVEQPPPVWSWLERQAKQYEKQNGTRVYLRAVSDRMMQSSDGAFPPDLLVSAHSGTPLAMQGYALFFRDNAARMTTPHPTSLLFIQVSPTPGPSPSPAPTPDAARFSVVLAPKELRSAVPGSVQSARILQDFAEGKGDAAILTAAQAKQLPFPVSACPVPEGKGFLPIYGSAATAEGEAFLCFLLAEPAQKALADSGLFSSRCSLYQGADPLFEMIENAL